MKLKIKSSQLKFRENYDRTHQWHLWFAWHPCRVSDRQVVFLERIYRKKDHYGSWDYSFEDPRK